MNTMRPLFSRRPFLRAAALLLVGAAALGLSACGKTAFHGADVTGATYASKLELPDADGKPRSLAEFKGKVVVVFFGYVHCPDVCPTTMAELREVKQLMGGDGAKLQVLFVTLDPERDLAPMLKPYVQGFDPSFVALRGTPEQTAAAAKEFKVFFQKVPGDQPNNYTLDHTAGAYVFDTDGRLRLFEHYGTKPSDWLEDIRAL